MMAMWKTAISLPTGALWWKVLPESSECCRPILRHAISPLPGLRCCCGWCELADRIAEAGYVERIGCPSDRRVTWITLTDLGEKVINNALERHIVSLRSNVLEPLGETSLNELGQHMRTLRDQHS
jgi:hypothetical protein